MIQLVSLLPGGVGPIKKRKEYKEKKGKKMPGTNYQILSVFIS
uniref:Uncharacterized protein n=1 Tax=Rhizophora mucronata TaxID=61149 RepID=A0A2P2IKB1_RHIMU